jgi:hypothetical protein
MSFCTNCGLPMKENHKFCQSCGAPVEAPDQPALSRRDIAGAIDPASPAAASQPQNVLPARAGETVTAVVHDIQLPVAPGERRDYNLIITNFRCIFAQKTAKVGQDALKKRNDNLAAQGKGFFGKWKAQVSGPSMYVEWYKSLTPDQALNETAGNFAFDTTAVVAIRTKWYGGEDQNSEYHTEIQTTDRNYKVIAGYDTGQIFKQVFGKQLFK